MKFKFIAPLTLFCLLLAVFFVRLLVTQPENLSSKTPLIGKTIPDFSLPALSGNQLTGQDLRGKTALINFFASWCESCPYEQPALQALTKKTGVPIYGIAWKDDDKKTRNWLKKFGNPYKEIGGDHSGLTGIEFGITGVPETFVIDSRGLILAKVLGPIDRDNYNNLVKILGKK